MERRAPTIIDLNAAAAKLSAYHLSPQQVKVALVAQNVEIPTGRVDREKSEQVLRTMARVEEVPEFNQIVVSTAQNGAPITIGDIGHAEDGIEEPRSLSRYDGKNAVALVVQKQSGTNTIQISDAVQARLAKIAKTLPPDIKTEIIQDQSRFVRTSMEEVKFHLLLAGNAWFDQLAVQVRRSLNR